jgi:hypothetical protein
MFIMMLVYIFFFGGGYYVVPLLLLGCVATHTLFFSMGHIFFENHGSGLGPAFFRLGTRVSPAMQKHFNLPLKLFQMVVENCGLKLVKPQLDNHTRFGKFIQTIGEKLGFDT